MEAVRNPSAVLPVEVVPQEDAVKKEHPVAQQEDEEAPGPLKAFVCSDEFEIACGCAIGSSVFVIWLQTDGVDAPFFIQFAESLVTAFFLLEWCLRVRVFGWRWLKGGGAMLDTFIVWCPGVLVVWVMQPLQIQAEASDLFKFFRIARVLRFVQLVKAFKHVSAFEDLWKLVRGLVSSGGTLASAMSLIVFNLYVFAIFCCELIGFQEFSSDASDGAKEAQQRFRGISASMLTLTRFMHGDDSQGIMDSLVEELPFIWVFLWTFTALSSFVLLNLVTAVIVQQAMDMSKGDEKEMAAVRKREQAREMKELEEMFREIDEDGSGIVSMAEFEEAFKDQTICDKFLMLGLKKEQALELFTLLDTGGEGELDLSEFMQGMSQLKGVAKSKDMVMLTKGIERLGKGINRMGESLGVVCKDEPQEPPNKLKERVGNLRGKLRERLQKSEDEMVRLATRMDRMLKEAEVAIRRIKSGQPAPGGAGQADTRKAQEDFAKSKSRSRHAEKKDEGRDSKEPRDKEGRDSKEPRDKKEPREKKERKDHREPREREHKEHREHREHREPKEHKERRGRLKRGETEDVVAEEAEE